jgi:uncharacterized membrane protein YcgQ (UPF0703/DUF1980 family)
MESQPESSLFEIRVNENGKSYIRKFLKLIVPGLIFFGLTFIIGLFASVRYIILSYSTTNSLKIPLTVRVTYFFEVLTSVVNLLAIIFYMRFAYALKKGLAKNDEELFNRSFRYLSRNALLFLVTMIMTLLIWSWSSLGGWLLDNF